MMTQPGNGTSCTVACWALAAGAGLVTFLLLFALGDFDLFPSLFLGGVMFALLGLLLAWLCCTPLPKPGEGKITSDAPERAPKIATAATAAGAAVAAGAAASAATASSDGDAAAKKAAADKAAADKAAADKAAADKAAADKAAADKAAADKAAADKAAADKAAADKKAADAKKAADKKSAEAAAAASTPDYDGDGVMEGENEGTRPEALDGPRGGKADNLKEIKGIGPKMEKLCNSLGFYHFDQIASWNADEVAWVNANLEGFKGRVTRDEWVSQAKILAAGGETEFSKKVEDGKVY